MRVLGSTLAKAVCRQRRVYARRLCGAARPPGAAAASPPRAHPPPRAAAARHPVAAAALGRPVPVAVEEEEEATAAGGEREVGSPDFRAIVKIHVTTLERDYVLPWQTRTASRSTGSGVLIEHRGDVCVVLTAAHVIADATFLQVQLAGQPDKVTARVLAVAHETDLALVEVPARIFEGVAPLTVAPLNALPALRDKVYVLGFPTGGDDLSITEGVVSRVEVQSYSHSHARALAITVDAAVNSGNSGGPVISEDSGLIVGIAFQGYAGSDIENQGHMVPAPLIQRFLAAAASGRSPGLPSLGAYLQTLQSPALRSRLRMGPSHSGMLVTSVEHGACCEGLLRPGDVLLELDGKRLSNDGTCVLLGRRLALAAVLHRRFFGDSIVLRLLRDGSEEVVTATLAPSAGLVPKGVYDAAPPYFLLAGLLFQTLSLEYLHTWGELEKAPPHLLALYYDGVVTPMRTEVVILTQVLADETNVGYSGDSHGMDVVTAINGSPVRSLRALVAATVAARSSGCKYLELSTERGDLQQRVVLRAAEVDAADARIAARYLVPANASPHFADLIAHKGAENGHA